MSFSQGSGRCSDFRPWWLVVAAWVCFNNSEWWHGAMVWPLDTEISLDQEYSKLWPQVVLGYTLTAVPGLAARRHHSHENCVQWMVKRYNLTSCNPVKIVLAVTANSNLNFSIRLNIKGIREYLQTCDLESALEWFWTWAWQQWVFSVTFIDFLNSEMGKGEYPMGDPTVAMPYFCYTLNSNLTL